MQTQCPLRPLLQRPVLTVPSVSQLTVMPKYTASQYLQWYAEIAVQSPLFQFLSVMIAVVAVQKTGPYQWILKNSHAVKVAVGVVAVAQLMQRWQLQDKQFKQCLKAFKAVENTNQVMATRSNVMEWRSCLQFLSKWHKVSLQSAYKLWQLKLGAVPACPANQWNILETGMPMGPSDQSIADAELPQKKVEQCRIDEQVRAYSEKQSMILDGNQFPDSIKRSLEKFEEPVKKWKSTRMTTVTEMDEAVAQFKQSVDMEDPVWF